MGIKFSEVLASENILNLVGHGMYMKSKDDLSYINANQFALCEIYKLKKAQLVDRYDQELPWEQYASSYTNYDYEALNNDMVQHVLFLIKGSDGNRHLVHDRKSVLIDDKNEPMGIIGVFTPIQNNFLDMLSYMSKLGQDNLKICHYLQNSPQEFNSQCRLTKRESVCLFYMLQGYTARQVAELTNTASKTVEFHLANIRLKWKCHTKQDLLGKANEFGCFNVLPIELFLDNSTYYSHDA